MSDLQITIRIDDEKAAWAPGETISGTVDIRALESWTAKSAELVLGWRSEGTGDEDSEAAETIDLIPKGESAPPQVTRPFRVTVPDMPWTYHGHHIKIHWALGVYIKLSWRNSATAERAIVVHPRPWILSGGDGPRA